MRLGRVAAVLAERAIQPVDRDERQAVGADQLAPSRPRCAAPPAACCAPACRCRRSRNASSAARKSACAPRARRPARTISTIFLLVVPRTIESSTRITRLPFSTGPVGGVLQLHAEMADVVGRLDEGAPDIVVADDAELERNAALGGVAHRRGHAGIRHRHDHVGGDRRLSRASSRADALARVIDRRALHHRIRAGEVDVFEHAEPRAACGRTA